MTTRISTILRQIAKNKNNRIRKALVGKARKEISKWDASKELKESAYRQVLRVSGYTHEMESHIQLLASAQGF